MNQYVRHTLVFVTVCTALWVGLWAAEDIFNRIFEKNVKENFGAIIFWEKISHQLWQLKLEVREMKRHLIHLFFGVLSGYFFYPYVLPCLLPEMLQVIDSISWTYLGRGFLEIYNSKSSQAMITHDRKSFAHGNTWRHLYSSYLLWSINWNILLFGVVE